MKQGIDAGITMQQIGALIRTQDNRATSHPLFIVQARTAFDSRKRLTYRVLTAQGDAGFVRLQRIDSDRVCWDLPISL